jgi:hypothetical protein
MHRYGHTVSDKQGGVFLDLRWIPISRFTLFKILANSTLAIPRRCQEGDQKQSEQKSFHIRGIDLLEVPSARSARSRKPLRQDICGGRAHRRCRKRRRIIDAIADHRHWTDSLQRLEHTNFVFGQQLRVKFVQTLLLRYRSRCATIVAREHDDAPDSVDRRSHDARWHLEEMRK